MRTVFFLLLLNLSAIAFSQTKKIAHRSHGGTTGFVDYVESDPNADNSNFGMAPEPLVVSAQLDSVILISDSVAIMITSEYCQRRRSAPEQKWKAGKDTLVHHPVFSNHLSVDEMRDILRTKYHFRNPVDKVVFIGYEEPVTMAQPAEGHDQLRLVVPVAILTLSCLGGWITWKAVS